MKMSKLVVFEGPDCVGKGTLSRALVADLTAEGKNVIRVEPTKESHPRGRKLIYSMLDSGAAKRHPNLFQLVQFMNRLYFQLFKLPKLMRDHELVILDRWALSGYVYGRCEGINSILNNAMYWFAKRPDLVLVLSGRSYKRPSTTDDSYEKDTKLQDAVRTEYLLASMYRQDHLYVHNDRTVDELRKDIRVIFGNKELV